MAFNGKLEEEFMWEQKYRPQTLDDMVMPKKMRQIIETYINTGNLPHLLFVSPIGGIGKSTLANILTNELDADFIDLNCSDENGIDTIRTILKPFATRESLFGDGPKIAWMDEEDGGSWSDDFALYFRSYTSLWDELYGTEDISQDIMSDSATRIGFDLAVDTYDYNHFVWRNDECSK